MDNNAAKYYTDPKMQWFFVPNTDFGYVGKVTLILEMWNPWVMDNNDVKYYLDQTREWEVMAWTRRSQTVRRVISTP